MKIVSMKGFRIKYLYLLPEFDHSEIIQPSLIHFNNYYRNEKFIGKLAKSN